LTFDAGQLVYADGVELFCPPACLAQRAA